MLHAILNTIAYGCILGGLVFMTMDLVERRSHIKAGTLDKLSFVNQQVAILLGIAGFVLLIISMWIT